MIKYLTVEEVVIIHDLAIREYGGSPEIAGLERLESVVATPQQTMFGEDLYPDLFSKAAILIYLLIKNHPFVDGNKRHELYQFTLDIATSALDKEGIEAWLRAHAVPCPA